MISYLKGNVVIAEDEYLVIECMGVGYKVFMPTIDISRLAADKTNVEVFTSMYIKDDRMELYGFSDINAQHLFEQLISVSGVGPKAAISIFSVMNENDIKFAILSDDYQSICKAPGIGKKTAQKLILELRDKFKIDDSFNDRINRNSQDYSHRDFDNEAVEALLSLGFNMTEINKAIEKSSKECNSSESLIKEALKYLY